MQLSLLPRTRPKGQLLKWVGNKYKYAHIITSYFPETFNRYFEPFIGIGAVLATLAPKNAIAGDIIKPLTDFWKLVQRDPAALTKYYEQIISRFNKERTEVYQEVRDRYNEFPNAFDLMILSRTCYGGVMRFTQKGTISTPIGPHKPISPTTFSARLLEWHERVKNTVFLHQSFTDTLKSVGNGDLVYCDPPYVDSQSILYGAQKFSFAELIQVIDSCKRKGARVVLSIDGTKKSGTKQIRLDIPTTVFAREVFLDCGSSMLRRFQNNGSVMKGEQVRDRLLLTW